MVRVRDDLADRVREIENVFIELSDGCRLAARVFLPIDEAPVPAILEYLPYRKRDFMRARDERMHRYFAAHGYVSLRVDIRGTGDSDGVLEDEYSVQEQLDGLEVITWIAQQPWCSGRVGMIGISWGGFNALQIAARRPPELGAIITLCASDDRYSDDAHYMGGCLLNENLQWGSILMTNDALPPDPEIVGERWRSMWLERLDAAVAFPALWMRHPLRDAQWTQGSVCEDYGSITCPVYAIGGWADGYSNAVPRLLEHLSSPKKGLIGPWAHAFPNTAIPGPRLGFLQESLRWWDRWLKDEDDGIMDEPLLTVWMQESVPPAPQYEHREGRWIVESAWPPPSVRAERWFLAPGSLEASPPSDRETMVVSSPQITGMVSGEWCAFGSAGEMPLDQRPDDGRSLVFDSAPLTAPLEILGAPTVALDLSVDREVALIAVRLDEVDPAGASTRISYGLLNLTHREGHGEARPMRPGARERVVVALNDIAHVFTAGHRVRLAISTAYWPIAWPPPHAAVLSLHLGEASLALPVRAGEDGPAPRFADPEVAPSTSASPMSPRPFRRTVERDLATGEVTYRLQTTEFEGHAMGHLPDIDLEIGHEIQKTHRICPNDPLTAQSTMVQWAMMRRGAWSVRIDCRTCLTSEADHLHFTAELVAREGDEEVRRLSWDERIARVGF